MVMSLSLGALLVATPAAHGDDVATGDDWSVNDLGGAYEVVLDLDEPLPIRDDAPTLIVDGEVIGLAQESANGRSLSVITADPAVAAADSVQLGWFSQGDVPADAEPAAGPEIEQLAPEPVLEIENADEGTPDPSVPGGFAYTKSIYKFGDQAIELAGIGGIRGEVEGKIYLPTTGGARPVVLFLHGRHSSCNGPGANPNRWPCGATQTIIPSYAGYDGAAEALASNGYAVISIAANAVNSNDNQLALDQGAKARGQLILDTLDLFRKANAGEEVSLYDANTQTDVTLADALSGNGSTSAAGLDPEIVEITPADLVGRLDYSRIGLMGHSRGGEGVTSAATLNNALDVPFDIVSILPLAPVDFGRMTVPNVPAMVLLPYCDGDVSNQQGQHMNDDARYAFDDDVLRSNVWVMGANHNFFNTVWTPAKYPLSSSDDWSGTSTTSARATDSVCGTAGDAPATSIRLSADDQYDVGTSLLSGWFRLSVGGEQQFLPMFDGSGAKVASTQAADIRVFATQPTSSRADIAPFTSAGSVRIYGTATASVCASLSGRTLPAVLPFCATTLASAQVPHWTPASNGVNVPTGPMTRMLWTSETGQIRVSIPVSARDASGHQNLSLKVAADESVAVGAGTDLTITVLDRTGASFSTNVSELNPNALIRFPQSTQNPSTLGKIVLQQVNLPISELAGLDVTDLREVRLTAAVGVDGLTSGGAYLSDLAFDTPALGTAEVKNEVTVGTSTTYVEEGAGPGTAEVAVALSEPSDKPIVAYATIAGSTSATAKVGLAMRRLYFAPGQTCKPVTVATYGDAEPGSAGSASFKISVINTSNAVMGADAFGSFVVREDDGVIEDGVELPPVGKQGDVCAEYAARNLPGVLSFSDAAPGPDGGTTVAGTGYRDGESVAFTLDGVDLGSAIAAADGTVELATTIPADTSPGAATVTAKGAGSGYSSTGELHVLHDTDTTLSISPANPKIKQKVTLSAQVTGADTDGTVEFFDGSNSLGVASTSGGLATLTVVGGFKAGSHSLTAVFGSTATADTSTSAPVAFTLTKGRSSIAMVLSAGSVSYGTAVRGTVAVANPGTGGTVVITHGSKKLSLAIKGGTARFTLPASLAVGKYTVSAKFGGNDLVEASSTVSSSFTVKKKSTSTTVTAPTKVKKGKNFTATITVKGAVAGTYPTGSVKVYVKQGSGSYKLTKTVSLATAKKGKVGVTLKASAKAGSMAVKVTYSGNTNYGAGTSAARKVTVVN